ncbi:MAG: hypothetical protein QOJ74_2313 [Ilumatobacteraceae bacterium]|nr:hypothetical protein [Ilumatobacteraceae bacterium]
MSFSFLGSSRTYNGCMSDFVLIVATIAFYAICALYVNWCDRIVGPDDFKSERREEPSE